jgi:hypothetical protein
MSTMYVNELLPRDAARVAIPGHVIQVIQTSYTSSTDLRSTSFISTGTAATITPTSSSSKILIIINLAAETYQNGSNGNDAKWEGRLMRNETQIMFKRRDSYAAASSNGYYSFATDGSFVKLDSPNTTDAITYRLDAKINNSSNSYTLRLSDSSSESTITLMEIAQ